MFEKIKSDFAPQLLALLPLLVNIFFCQSQGYWLRMEKIALLRQPDFFIDIFLFITFEMGKLLFSWPAGMLFDRYGSKKITLVVGCINFFTLTMQIFIVSPILIYIIRFVGGISYALNFCTYVAVFGELSSPAFRGIFASIISSSAVASVIVEPLIENIFFWLQSRDYNRFGDLRQFMNISTVVLYLVFIPTAYFLVESPYFLARAGDHESAKQNLRNLHRQNSTTQIEEELRNIKRLIESERRETNVSGKCQFYSRKSFRKILFKVCLINGLAALPNSDSVYLESFRFLRFSSPFSSILNNFILLLLPLFIIERFSRRALFLVSCIVIAFANSFSASLSYFRLYTNGEYWIWIINVLVAVIIFIVLGLLDPLCNLVTTEFFPTNIKGRAIGCVLFTRSVCAIFIYLLAKVILNDNYINYVLILYFFCVSMLMLALIVYLYLPKSRGKSLVDLQSQIGLTNSECIRNSDNELEMNARMNIISHEPIDE